MSQDKNKEFSAARVVGGVLVALSGFVPIPQIAPTGLLMSRSAHAKSIKVNVTGQFVSGIVLSSAKVLNFGKFVATKKTGNYGLKTDSGLLANGEGKAAVAPAAGKFKLKMLVNLPIDITVAKIGADIALSATAGGAATQGALFLQKIIFNKQLDSGGAITNTITAAPAATTAKATNIAAKKADFAAGAVVTFGANLTWTGARPIGQISNGNAGNIILTITN